MKVYFDYSSEIPLIECMLPEGRDLFYHSCIKGSEGRLNEPLIFCGSRNGLVINTFRSWSAFLFFTLAVAMS